MLVALQFYQPQETETATENKMKWTIIGMILLIALVGGATSSAKKIKDCWAIKNQLHCENCCADHQFCGG